VKQQERALSGRIRRAAHAAQRRGADRGADEDSFSVEEPDDADDSGARSPRCESVRCASSVSASNATTIVWG
jgi:hypothetical protein